MAEVFVDNDVSAYNGHARAAYRRMLEAIKGKEVDAVVVWHLDRLHRHPKELEEFFEACDAAGIKDLASVTGDVDLSPSMAASWPVSWALWRARSPTTSRGGLGGSTWSWPRLVPQSVATDRSAMRRTG